MNAWQSIFLQTRVNSGYYDEDALPHLKWDWPNGTWLQGRLEHVREFEPLRNLKTQEKRLGKRVWKPMELAHGQIR